MFLSECKSKGKWKFADCKCVRKDRKKGVGGGIAFCIAPEFREYCVERTCSIPGVLVLEVKLKVARSDGGSKALLLIGVYIPPEGTPSKRGQSERSAIMTSLPLLVKKICEEDAEVMLIGDPNARVADFR